MRTIKIIKMKLVPFQPPEGLSIIQADVHLRQLIFSWSPVAPDCPAIHYNILASNCGSCPTTTNHTTVACTNVPTDGSVCDFSVQSVVCENITGNFSKSIQGLLKDIATVYKSVYSFTEKIYHITFRKCRMHRSHSCC